jgi:hypothetical protein
MSRDVGIETPRKRRKNPRSADKIKLLLVQGKIDYPTYLSPRVFESYVTETEMVKLLLSFVIVHLRLLAR